MNTQLQEEEIEALKAIYDDSFSSSGGGECKVIFPDDYPSHSPPVYELRSAPWLDSSDLTHIDAHFQRIYHDGDGEVVVYQWVEWLREWLRERAISLNDLTATTNLIESPLEEQITPDPQPASKGPLPTQCPDILHGEPFTDRKSTFQAHLARVTSTEEVKAVISVLKENKKIATATHNITAYRIHHPERSVFQQDCDDDGEAAAGGRLLHLLQIMDVRDAVVVVTRWFGGILLHADRFKHINNVARRLIQETGLGLEHKISMEPGSKEKKHSSKLKGKHK